MKKPNKPSAKIEKVSKATPKIYSKEYKPTKNALRFALLITKKMDAKGHELSPKLEQELWEFREMRDVQEFIAIKIRKLYLALEEYVKIIQGER